MSDHYHKMEQDTLLEYIHKKCLFYLSTVLTRKLLDLLIHTCNISLLYTRPLLLHAVHSSYKSLSSRAHIQRLDQNKNLKWLPTLLCDYVEELNLTWLS